MESEDYAKIWRNATDHHVESLRIFSKLCAFAETRLVTFNYKWNGAYETLAEKVAHLASDNIRIMLNAKC